MDREEHLHAELVFCLGKLSTHPQGAGYCLLRCRPQLNFSSLFPESVHLNLPLGKKIFTLSLFQCKDMIRPHHGRALSETSTFHKIIVLVALFRRQRVHWSPGRSHSQVTGTSASIVYVSRLKILSPFWALPCLRRSVCHCGFPPPVPCKLVCIVYIVNNKYIKCEKL